MLQIGRHDVRLHSISVHFTNALYPVAQLFLVLSYFYQRDFSLFAYFHLMILATVSGPFSYITGVIEWKQKYKGAKVRIFARKQWLGLLLLGLGMICTLWYSCQPDVLKSEGSLRIVFLLLNFAILPNVIYLGYLGGKLVFGSAH